MLFAEAKIGVGLTVHAHSTNGSSHCLLQSFQPVWQGRMGYSAILFPTRSTINFSKLHNFLLLQHRLSETQRMGLFQDNQLRSVQWCGRMNRFVWKISEDLFSFSTYLECLECFLWQNTAVAVGTWCALCNFWALTTFKKQSGKCYCYSAWSIWRRQENGCKEHRNIPRSCRMENEEGS